jgi:hypothetical protein
VEGVQVEVMGDVQSARPGGGWEAPPQLDRVIAWVEEAGLHLPVITLAHEAQAYRKMGRLQRAAVLERWLQEHG